MKKNDINIRDPYILLHDDKYYLYGTRSATCWGEADGFDAYVSDDLENWEGPVEIFKKPKGFWADRYYWAPECIYYKGSFYLISTFGCEGKKGIQILKSDQPLGPFAPITDGVVTPQDWCCIDGTIYIDKEEQPWLIFSHSFEDVPDGDMCAFRLSDDLKERTSDVLLLFSAVEAPWAVPIPFAKAEFGMDGDVYFTDGPTIHEMSDGKLLAIWSSWGMKGYTVGMAVSESGKLDGQWRHLDRPLFGENGGHGMLFHDKEGKLYYALHYPNDLYKEHPCFFEVEEQGDGLALKN